jgi:epoxyqueuosine reductase
MMKIEEIVRAWAKRKGYRYVAGDVSLAEEARSTLKKRRDAGEIEARFYRENLASFSYLKRCPIKNPQSIIIIAVPRPAHILHFTLGDKKIETIIPPTYVRYRKLFEEVRDDLVEALSGLKCRLEILNAPLKLLGNRLGLLSYGRNNVGYIDGLGSYFQLVGLVSHRRLDVEVPPHRPAETLLARCRDCRICAAACPTGAIDRARVLLHAEKCYTLFSESPKPIPESLKPPSPKCLVGCLRCQEVCPENKGLLRREEAAVSFDAEETEAFLGVAGKPQRTVERTRAKFLELGLTEGISILSRNLNFMLRLWGDAVPGKG